MSDMFEKCDLVVRHSSASISVMALSFLYPLEVKMAMWLLFWSVMPSCAKACRWWLRSSCASAMRVPFCALFRKAMLLFTQAVMWLWVLTAAAMARWARVKMAPPCAMPLAFTTWGVMGMMALA